MQTADQDDPVAKKPRSEQITAPVLSLKDWCSSQQQQQHGHDDAEGSLLLDLREKSVARPATTSACSKVHPRVIPIPLKDLQARSFELPPRHISFAVLVDCDDQDTTTNSNSNNEERISSLEKARRILLGRPGSRHKPWLVTAWVVDPRLDESADCLLCRLPRTADATTKALTRKKTRSASAYQPLPRLWQPDSMVSDLLLPLLRKQLAAADASVSAQTTEIWDLGAGSGRDVCFLAEELKTEAVPGSVRVVALDQRYRTANETDTLQAFWKRRGVGDVTCCRQVQLDQVDQVITEIKEQSDTFQCLFAVRYWNRPLFERLLEQEWLPKGTIIGISQFGKPHPGAQWEFAHPKEKHVLERNELRDLFAGSRHHWKIWHDQVVSDSDHGRTLIQFVAQLVEQPSPL